MTLIAVTSAKHSPGASTLTAALAAVAAEDRTSTLLEIDPSGGDLAARAGLRLEPGLATLAGAARHGLDLDLLERHSQMLASGVRAIVAPTTPDHATSAARIIGDRLPGGAVADATVLADLGRWAQDHPAARLLHAADAVLLLIAPTVEGVEHARNRLTSLPATPDRLTVVAVGRRPYDPPAIGRVLGVPVSWVDFDPRGAELVGSGAALDRWLRRSPFVRSVRTLLDQLRGAAVPEQQLEAR